MPPICLIISIRYIRRPFSYFLLYVPFFPPIWVLAAAPKILGQAQPTDTAEVDTCLFIFPYSFSCILYDIQFRGSFSFSLFSFCLLLCRVFFLHISEERNGCSRSFLDEIDRKTHASTASWWTTPFSLFATAVLILILHLGCHFVPCFIFSCFAASLYRFLFLFLISYQFLRRSGCFRSISTKSTKTRGNTASWWTTRSRDSTWARWRPSSCGITWI